MPERIDAELITVMETAHRLGHETLPGHATIATLHSALVQMRDRTDFQSHDLCAMVTASSILESFPAHRKQGAALSARVLRTASSMGAGRGNIPALPGTTDLLERIDATLDVGR